MIRRLACVLAAASMLAACPEIPQPFRNDGPKTSLARPKLGRGVTILPGTDGDGQVLAEAMLKALEDLEIPASIRPGPAFGHVVDSRAEIRGKDMAVEWTLIGPDGQPVGRYRNTLPMKAYAVGGEKRLAIEAAQAFSQPLSDPDSLPAKGVAPQRRSAIRVVPIKGLPGDGDTALTRAIRAALQRGGLAVVDEGGEYRVEGKVTVARGLPGEDVVTVAWVVTREGGGELGVISQDGAVPRGRLDLPWGPLARDIAEGGASGVAEVVKADVEKASGRK